MMICIHLPAYIQRLAGIEHEVQLDMSENFSLQNLFDWLESNYPMLKGTIRENGTAELRPYLRLFLGDEDLSDFPLKEVLPVKLLADGKPLRIVAAISGG